MMEARQRRFLAEINVVPLVDVVLVLLVIFMVTAPMLHRGLDVKLPTSTSNTIRPEERVIVTIERDQKIFLDKELVGTAQLEGKLRGMKLRNPDVGIYLRADRTVPYGSVVQVMDSVKRAGIEKLGMVTDAPGEERVVDETIRSKLKGGGR